ncbi:glycosyltransferase [Novosphingobium cyanobacteriorum]|uniref:Glycosyltransferase n=1 Tax=Novosphingobium cyanobacteriorum TaxID=3024215 RepID=A0ABT6CDV0_9SPHN|nr:glycosyltransferase [Novosphingobium cyanobacteriorum]MDF8332095.1 glycosyltransferase [Novosphingobium cyanobacteriorum]
MSIAEVEAQRQERKAFKLAPEPGLSPEERVALALQEIENRNMPAAVALLDPALLPDDAALVTKVDWAEALSRAQEHELSDALFEDLMRKYPRNGKVHFNYARRVNMRGLAMKSLRLLQTTKTFAEGTNQHQFVMKMWHLCDLLEAREGRTIPLDEDCRLLAMKHAIGAYANRVPRELPKDRLGRLTMVTGSLGPGGAERQLTRAAAQLELARRAVGEVGGIPIERPVEVLVRAHDSGQQRDFFLADLQTAQVELHQINLMKPEPISSYGIGDEDLEALLDYLPLKVNFGIRRLVRHFRESQPDVVSLWQDGACLFAGLAALVAGVPRIQLMIRGLPPVIRRHMFQPDYEVMYRALAAVPGVEFISNSRGAAQAYADWLDLPIERFAILYNGVQQMDCQPTEALDTVWQDFEERTKGATQTIGGVFRFDTDKRPITWVRFAARYAKRHPEARFVLVGHGRLFADAVRVATELGVADKILFVGRSTEVGYWMKKMDVLVLMSSFEGLPNVLIEAQFLGVPVVSTPAGGAAECFIEGVTGHILNCADKTDLDEACEKVHALLGRAQDPDIFGPATRDFLEPNFAVPRMLENFVRLCCHADPA